MAITTHIELLAGVLASSPRRPLFALITDVYPIVNVEEGFVEGSLSVSDIRDLTIIIDTPLIVGNVGVEAIIQDAILIEYDEIESKITGVTSIDSITQKEVLIEYSEIESKITAEISIDSIIQKDVVISDTTSEDIIEGSVSIDSITQN